MIGELVETAASEIKSPAVESFKDIKPQNEMSVRELNDAVKTEFDKAAQEHSETHFADGDSTEKTEPEHFKCQNEDLAGKEHPVTGVPFEKRIVVMDGKKLEVVVPKFDSEFDAKLPNDLIKETDKAQFAECNSQLKDAVAKDPELREKFTAEQLEQIENGDTPDGYVWHHDAEVGKMQLVDAETHAKTGHTGGRSIWGGGSSNR